MSERPTPRTASAMMEIPSRFDSIWVVPAEVACDLERELGDALRELDEAREALDCLLAVIGLTPIAGNKHALQEAVDHGLAVLRKQQEAVE